MPQSRSVREGRQPQGIDESIRWRIVVNPPALTAGAVTVTDETSGTDVSGTTLTGTAEVQGGALLLPALAGLTEGRVYRVDALFGDGTNTLGVYVEVEAER